MRPVSGDAPKRDFDIWVVDKNGESWGEPRNLGEKVNSRGSDSSPRVSPDGRYLFFSSSRGFGGSPRQKRLAYQELVEKLRGPGNGLRDIYQMDLSFIDIKK